MKQYNEMLTPQVLSFNQYRLLVAKTFRRHSVPKAEFIPLVRRSTDSWGTVKRVSISSRPVRLPLPTATSLRLALPIATRHRKTFT
jgi:hypothetical protein